MSKINIKDILLKERQLRNLIFCIVLTLMISFLSTYQPVVLQRIIDNFDLDLINMEYRQLWIFFSVSICIFLLNIALIASKTNFSYAFKHKVREYLLNSLNFKEETFYHKYPSGKINDVLTKDVDEIMNFFSATFLPLLSDIIMVFTVIIILLFNNLSMGIVFTIYFFISLFILYRTQSKNSNIIEITRNLEVKNANDIEEVLLAKNEIMIMNKKDNILTWLEERYHSLWPYKKLCQKFIYKSWITSLCLVSISNIVSLFLGGTLFFNGHVEIGFVFLAFNFSQRIQQPLETMQMHLANWNKLKVSLANLDEIAEENLEQEKNSIMEKGSLILKDINYTYKNEDKHDQVLKDINMTFERKKLTVISGKTGSGKTTILKLLMKQLGGYHGNITLNNKDYNCCYNIQDINKLFLYLNGDNSFLTASLKDNLTCFNPISDEEFFKKINDFPLCNISPRLKNLNVEQWTVIPYTELDLFNDEIQVLNLLRILFSKKEVVIFDEAFSKLNKEKSECFVEFLKNYLKVYNMIGIIVTHYTDTIYETNYMYKIEDSQVVAEGKPKNVIKLGGADHETNV